MSSIDIIIPQHQQHQLALLSIKFAILALATILATANAVRNLTPGEQCSDSRRESECDEIYDCDYNGCRLLLLFRCYCCIVCSDILL